MSGAAAAARETEAEMSEGNTVKVSAASFDDDVLKASTPVVVDFWAEWCAPCLQIAPALEEIASEMSGKVVVAKINVDENQELAVKYNVRSIPTLMLFKDGEVVAQEIGAAQKSRITTWIESHV